MADLTTLTSVKNWLGVPLGNTSQDALFSQLITATSADFLRAIKRPDLLTASYTETREGDGSRRLILRHWPVTDITTLKLAGADVPQQNPTATPPVDGYYLDAGADPERAFVLYLSGDLVFTDQAAILITYDAGYAATPDDIAQAVTEWVAYRYTKKAYTGQTQNRSVEGESTHIEESTIPPNTQRVIGMYTRKFAAYGTDAADSSIGDSNVQVTIRNNRNTAK